MELFVYSVRWYCDLGEGGKMITSSGIVAAESVGDAVCRLTDKLYEQVEWVKVFCVEGGDCGYAEFNYINDVVIENELCCEE